jgi:MerR family transcriptional regulator, heat shock protein HspR
MMARKPGNETVRYSRTEWVIDDDTADEPRYGISIVAERCGVRTTTLRLYEEFGLLEPARSGQRRLYSESDIDRIRRIRRLVDDLGLNLAGVAAVLHLRQQVIALQRELDAMRDRIEG